MWWGHSPPLDLLSEISEKSKSCLEGAQIHVLIVGASDTRHIIKTLAASYLHPASNVVYHIVEPTLEQVARSILLLNICLDESLGLQEATLYFMEIMGNTLLRPATAKYLANCTDQLADVSSQTVSCPWLSLEKFRHKDRDAIESIFKFWKRAACEGIPIIDYWERRIRRALKTRYDYREGVFDWDFHMVLKSRGCAQLTIQEYRFWRSNGVAYTWLEGEPARGNPTLLSNIVRLGDGFLHYAYLGDIACGPFFTWALTEREDKKKSRATDVAEREVMRAIHEIQTREPFCDQSVAAHRDLSILNGTIITELPNNDTEQGSWMVGRRAGRCKESIPWKSVPRAKVIFHPVASLESFRNRTDYIDKFHLIWIAHNMTDHISNLAPLVKREAFMLVESPKYFVDLRDEHLHEFTKKVNNAMRENGLRDVNNFSSMDHTIGRFCKI